MEYREFVKALINGIRETECVENLEVSFKTDDDEPENDRICVVICDDEEAVHLMQIHSQGVYQEFQSGRELESIVQEMEADIIDYRAKIIGRLKILRIYDSAKDSLFIKAVRYEKEELEGQIYRVVGDIALVLCFEVQADKNEIMTVKVPAYMLREWKKNKEDVWEDAMENTVHKAEPRVYDFMKMILSPEYDGDRFMEEGTGEAIKNTPVGNCISSSNRINGATVMFYPGTARRISDLMGGVDLYVVFTSVIEAMVHDVDTVSKEDLSKILKEILETSVEKEEILSEHIYRYNRETDCIEMIDD